MDREKVKKGLDICTSKEPCNGCPYLKERNCSLAMVADALALLKEQEAVVRCNDCKWYDEKISICDNCHLPRERTFFCADGVAKDINVHNKEGR